MTQKQRKRESETVTETKHQYDSRKFITEKYLTNLSKRVDVKVNNHNISCGDWEEIEYFMEDVWNADCIDSQEKLEAFLEEVDCGAVFENSHFLPAKLLKVAEEISDLQETIEDGVTELVFKK